MLWTPFVPVRKWMLMLLIRLVSRLGGTTGVPSAFVMSRSWLAMAWAFVPRQVTGGDGRDRRGDRGELLGVGRDQGDAGGGAPGN
jgi:hypothetical protein